MKQNGNEILFYVCSDVHNHTSAFLKLLDTIDISNENVRLIVAGDLFDKGPGEDIMPLYEATTHPHLIYLKGNHEAALGTYLISRYEQNRRVSYPFETPDTLAKHLSKDELIGFGYQLMGLPLTFETKIGLRRFRIAHSNVPSRAKFGEARDEDFYYKISGYKRQGLFTTVITGHVPVGKMQNNSNSKIIWKNASRTVYNVDMGLGDIPSSHILGALELNSLREIYIEG